MITIDTGGTFTDAVIQDDTGRLTIGKALTTPKRAFEGMYGAISAAAALLELTPEHVIRRASRLIFGTTRATNAIVTRLTARTALFVTAGFPDILYIREGGKKDAHDFRSQFPEPYVPRRLTFEIAERINAEGGVEAALDEAGVVTAARELERLGVEAVGVCLLWSIVNPAHELRIAQLLAEHAPRVAVTLSHEILPIPREYRRASAAVLDASLKPVMQKFLEDMAADLGRLGFSGDLLVSTTVGGCIEVAAAACRPVHLAKSGPAMVPLAAREYAGRVTSNGDVIICDTGGTTFDVGLIRGGEVVRTRETWLGQRYTGELLALSSVDIRSVGAGGGSIAWVDDGGLLHVGPQSAGSVPGPACYPGGGILPTVTDAAVVAGYIDPHLFLGGRIILDASAARTAVATVADALSLSVEETALAILTVADETMISAIQDITVSEGVDPRESVFVAGGGAAGLNIASVARALGCKTVLLPQTASALSACGMQFSDVVAEEAASSITNSDSFDQAAIRQALARAHAALDTLRAGLKIAREAACSFEIAVDARYRAQIWELEVPLPGVALGDELNPADLVERFHKAHERTFGVDDPDGVVEFLTWKVRLRVALPRPVARPITGEKRECLLKRQNAYFPGRGLVDTPFYDGPALRLDEEVAGPAIILEPTTTIVVPPNASACLSPTGSYILKLQR
ncbi:hydantoinase/oxoprolinase family protein [Bradyrhizobium sp. 153]|uniref:hydantoinase/oxoprolinase family protein n=1 Tax=Bradyrhizobium sp. 153 TaxID=2782627 RepID=UPI001FFB71C7